MEEQVSKEKSCGILIAHRTKDDLDFLLLHYPNGHWEFPKGHVEENESELKTAIRELEEETGITHVDVKDGYKEVIHYFFMHKGVKISKNVVFFLGEVSDKEVALSYEHQNFEWLPYKEAIKRVPFKNSKQLLEKAYNFLV